MPTCEAVMPDAFMGIIKWRDVNYQVGVSSLDKSGNESNITKWIIKGSD